MAVHYGVQLTTAREPDATFAASLLGYLLEQSAEPAAGGPYSLVGDPDREDVFDTLEDTADLDGVLDEYRARDPSATSLSVDLRDDGRRFSFVFVPGDRRGCRARLWTHSSDVSTPEDVLALASLAGDLFERFDFRYGTYTNEHEPVVPIDWDEIRTHHPRAITLYPPRLVEEIGRERLLATPARRTREFDDGGVQLDVCATTSGACPELEAAREHLQG